MTDSDMTELGELLANYERCARRAPDVMEGPRVVLIGHLRWILASADARARHFVALGSALRNWPAFGGPSLRNWPAFGMRQAA